jgi:hypothetical protein
MARLHSLASASGGDAAEHFRYANVTRDEHLNENEISRLRPDPGAGVEMGEGSLALQTSDQQLVSDDHDDAVTGFAATIPTNQRFAVWSLRYLFVLGAVDALIGCIAFAVPASISETLYLTRPYRSFAWSDCSSGQPTSRLATGIGGLGSMLAQANSEP